MVIKAEKTCGDVIQMYTKVASGVREEHAMIVGYSGR